MTGGAMLWVVYMGTVPITTRLGGLSSNLLLQNVKLKKKLAAKNHLKGLIISHEDQYIYLQ